MQVFTAIIRNATLLFTDQLNSMTTKDILTKQLNKKRMDCGQFPISGTAYQLGKPKPNLLRNKLTHNQFMHHDMGQQYTDYCQRITPFHPDISPSIISMDLYKLMLARISSRNDQIYCNQKISCRCIGPSLVAIYNGLLLPPITPLPTEYHH